MGMSAVEKCMYEVEKKLAGMENGTVTIKGVSNVSVADLDTVLLYAEYVDTGRLHELMRPVGNVRRVLEAYGIEV